MMGDARRHRFWLLSGAAVLAVAAGPADAAPAKAQGACATDEIIVTARRREERLQDVPVSATVLSEQFIENLGGLRDAKDLLANIPGTYLVDTTSPANSEISIRGSGTSLGTSAEGAVGLYRDGFFVGGGIFGGRSFARMDLFDVAQIEVLKGPQGALYGRNAVGGAINVRTKRPVFEREGYVRGTLGNNERHAVTLIHNEAITDTLAVRIGVDYDDQEKGEFFNPRLDRYYDAREWKAVKGQVRYKPGALDINLAVDRAESHGPTLYYYLTLPPSAAFPQGAFQPRTSAAHNANEHVKQFQTTAILTAEYDLGFAELTSITAYRKTKTRILGDIDAMDEAFLAMLQAGGGAMGVNAFSQNNNIDDNDRMAQELRLASAHEGPLQWLLGVDATRQLERFTLHSTQMANAAAPVMGTTTSAKLNFVSTSVFGSLDYELTEGLNVTGELRYTRDDKTYKANITDYVTGVPVPGRFIGNRNVEHTTPSYTLAVSWRAMPDWLLYGRFASAYRAGGFNNNLGDPRAPNPVVPAYEDERGTTWELGTKVTIGDHTFATLSGYVNQTDELIATASNGCGLAVPQCPVVATVFVQNVGKGENKAVELETNSRWPLWGGQLSLSTGVSRQWGEVTQGQYAGADIPGLPEWTAVGNLNYRHPLFWELSGLANLQYTGRWGGTQVLSIVDQPRLRADDYQLLNLRLGVATERWEIVGFVNNLTDESYNVFANASTFRPNPPRSYGATATFRW